MQMCASFSYKVESLAVVNMCVRAQCVCACVCVCVRECADGQGGRMFRDEQRELLLLLLLLLLQVAAWKPASSSG